MAFVNVYSQTSDSTKKKDLGRGELKKKRKKHSRLIALLLCTPLFLLGLYGVHRWYLKKYLTAAIMTFYTIGSIGVISLLSMIGVIGYSSPIVLIVILALVPVIIWMLIDFVRIITGDLKFEDGTETKW